MSKKVKKIFHFHINWEKDDILKPLFPSKQQSKGQPYFHKPENPWRTIRKIIDKYINGYRE